MMKNNVNQKNILISKENTSDRTLIFSFLIIASYLIMNQIITIPAEYFSVMMFSIIIFSTFYYLIDVFLCGTLYDDVKNNNHIKNKIIKELVPSLLGFNTFIILLSVLGKVEIPINIKSFIILISMDILIVLIYLLMLKVWVRRLER
ncbi:hypothetical protein MHJ97_01965 [Macrococcus epidermidis]|uniref:hypothetical protein n=1 Tax=Macrococcus epidermidis TaxID=1902580 RepID=UPI001EF1CB6E|nr:hypothetical protein [Macrococcus epidermidis]MCG7419201.1 hypothetical protein [Macrococcus epidermidis]